MKKNILRIALAQINTTVGDLSGNREKIVEYISKAISFEADLVVFPELALTGYPPEDLLLRNSFIEDNLIELNRIAYSVKDITAIVGCVDKDKNGNIYNSAAVICNGKISGIYHKINLPNYGVFDEKRYFTAGSEIKVFKLGDVIFGVNICEDIWQGQSVAKIQASNGASVIINISASPYHAGKINLRKAELVKRVKETKAFICYNNLVGGQDELVFDGGSLILDNKTKLVASAEQFKENLIVQDLEINYLTRKSLNRKVIVKLGAIKENKKAFLPRGITHVLDRVEEVYGALVLGTRDYILKNGFKKAVIGLSGGIDSALVAAIASDAIGKDNCVGISMPSRYTSNDTRSDAKILADNLGIRFMEIAIEDIFISYLKTLEESFRDTQPNIAEENLQARIRGNILMALSNKFGWLVLTTGNKSEVSTGYCTLYGDMAGGFAVIKDVPKTLVYELSLFKNKMHKSAVIPESIILRAPTAELKPNQKDQDTLPEYDVLDSILKKYIEEENSLEKIVSSTKIPAEIVKKVINMVDRSEYKRRQSAPGIKITLKAFGKDRRLPITNRYR